jgi:hypothetical protein
VDAYMGAPWTRDGTVRVYVVTMAPEVAGCIVELPVKDNQFVHKGDLLMVIDPTDYKIAVRLNEAAVQQAKANAQNAARDLLFATGISLSRRPRGVPFGRRSGVPIACRLTRIHLVWDFELVEVPGADGAATDDVGQPLHYRLWQRARR